MKLLLVTRDFSGRQAAISTWSVELAERLARRCEDFAVLSLGRAGATATESTSFEWLGPASSVPTLRHIGAWRAELSQAIRRFEVVLGADWLSAAAGLAWRGRSSIRRVCAVVHGPELEWRGPPATWPIAPLCRTARSIVLGRADGVLTVSGYARAWLEAQEPRVARSDFIGRGCDVERFRPSARGNLARDLGLSQRRVLLSVCRLVPERRIDKVLFAVSALGVRFPDLRYVIVGEGPERKRLERLAKRLRISHRIRFLGEVDAATLPAVYNLCDVFVQLSAAASPPDVCAPALLEALACAKPVVVTASAASEEIVDEQVGFSVPDGDSTELAEALTTLLDRRELAAQMGERGRARVLSRATWDAVADRVLSVLDERKREPALRSARALEPAPPAGLRWEASRGMALAER
jgi:phosphatidylinositol alpha-1,6-mannosyltransferase